MKKNSSKVKDKTLIKLHPLICSQSKQPYLFTHLIDKIKNLMRWNIMKIKVLFKIMKAMLT